MSSTSDVTDQSYAVFGNGFVNFNFQRYLIPESEQKISTKFMDDNLVIFFQSLLLYPEDLVGPLFVYGYQAVNISWRKFYEDNMNDDSGNKIIEEFKIKLKNKYPSFRKWCSLAHMSFFYYQRVNTSSNISDKSHWPEYVVLWETLLKRSVDKINEIEKNSNITLVESEENVAANRKRKKDVNRNSRQVLSTDHVLPIKNKVSKINNKEKSSILDKNAFCQKLNELTSNTIMLKEYQKEIEKFYMSKIKLLQEKNTMLETENVKLKAENVKIKQMHECVKKMLENEY